MRARARGLGLATAEKPESQEICFVPDGDYARVVGELRPGSGRAGEIVDSTTGRVLGSHEGIHHFTVGQRKGLGSGGVEPRYVVRLDAVTNRVLVGPASALGSRAASLSGMCWTRERAEGDTLRGEVQVRYKHEAVPALITLAAGGAAHVAFDVPVRAVAPGQAAVIYQGEELLGGGWIDEALP